MGTRADFYIGRGEKAEWIGSIAWDGNPEGSRCAPALHSTSESAFKKRVAELARNKNDVTFPPDDPWPWPWQTSATTDYAYAWDDGAVYVSCFGRAWLSANQLADLRDAQEVWETKLTAAEKVVAPGELPVMNEEEPEWPETPAAIFPVMKTDKAAPPGSKRSGIMVFGLK